MIAGKRSAKSSGGWCLGWLNLLLLATVMSAAAWCLHLHCEGDYSKAGLQAAMPRLQKSFFKLQNVTIEALQPKNLRSTGQIVFKNVNATVHQGAAAVQKAAYAGQEYLEVYTGDLTPYTSKVSQGAGVVYKWTCAQSCALYHWLLDQDWQGRWDACAVVLATLWKKMQVSD